jgi:hypothetical protein
LDECKRKHDKEMAEAKERIYKLAKEQQQNKKSD